MKKRLYKVLVSRKLSVEVSVMASNKDEAYEKAIDKAMAEVNFNEFGDGPYYSADSYYKA